MPDVLNILLVEDNARLRPALKAGLETTGTVRVARDCETGEAALVCCLREPPDAILMDVQLAGAMNGIDAAVKRIAEKHGTLFVDTQDAFNRVLAACPSAAIAWDRVHPNHIGHMILARAFLRAIGFEW